MSTEQDNAHCPGSDARHRDLAPLNERAGYQASVGRQFASEPDLGGRMDAVYRALETVTDPEIPVLNVLDLGIIAGVRLQEDTVVIEMTPTFVGCPALDVIRRDIHQAVVVGGERRVQVNVVFDPPWSTHRISEKGRQKLRAFGLAPPPPTTIPGHCRAEAPDCASSVRPVHRDFSELRQVECPHCGSRNTHLESPFGPTLCRSIHYCNGCLQSFEHFKPL